MKEPDWETLRLFAAVARHGGLAGASAESGLSAPTLGRRMLALEEATGRTLFVRSQAGYRLTADGDALFRRVRDMEASARPIAEWMRTDARRPVVRLSAGTWTTHFLADHFPEIWTRQDSFRIAFRTTEARLDIGHREIDIGIRNRIPETGNLASRPLQTLAFAPFKARAAGHEEAGEWVAISTGDAVHPAARWLQAQEDAPIAAWANSPRTLLDLVLAGAGKGVMPCFIGDREPRLQRAGPIIAELTERQYLVMHNDDRHRPELRTVIDRLSALFASKAALLDGSQGA